MVKKKNHGTLAGLVGTLAIGFALGSNVRCDYGDSDKKSISKAAREYSERDNVVVERNDEETYRAERVKIVDNLEKAAEGRLFDRNALFGSKLENKDLETFVEIYTNDRQFREDENWGEDYAEFNPNANLGIEKLIEYEKDTPGLNLIPEGYLLSPDNYLWSDVDKTAVAQCMIMNCDVDFGTITF